ncbi:hypothetical protein BC332_25978 [Capsicum chinense]|nr:hypothetical protein BC332_25978 [Capsicum chinense]
MQQKFNVYPQNLHLNIDTKKAALKASPYVVSLESHSGRKIQANAEADSDAPVDPPKVEEKLGVVLNGLSTDSNITEREAEFMSRKTL